jgi:nitrogen-specific signal transduction histidine kinase
MAVKLLSSGNGVKELYNETNQFAFALAHEVRNPLATINLAVQMLKAPIKIYDDNLYLAIIIKAS